MDGAILVLGAGGQVGTALKREILEPRYHVRYFGRDEIDILDASQIDDAVEDLKPAILVNLAAYTDVDGAETNPHAAARINCEGAENIAKICQSHGTALIHLSTDFVFDGLLGRPYVENDPVSPVNEYGKSKAEGEVAVVRALDRHVILRTAWVFGSDRRNFVSAVLNRARSDETLKMVSDQAGCPTSTADIAAAIREIINRLDQRDGPWGIYHFGGAPSVSRDEFARAIIETAGERISHTVIIEKNASAEVRAGAKRPTYAALNCAKIENDFGIVAPNWRDALDSVVAELFTGLCAE